MNFENNGRDTTANAWVRPAGAPAQAGLDAICAAFEADIFASCVTLTDYEQAVARLAAMYASGDQVSISGEVANALNAGLSAQSICEVALQSTIYVGCRDFSVRLQQLDTVLARLGAERTEADTAFSDNLAEASAQMRTMLHGERSSSGYADQDDPLTGQLYRITSLYGYGAIWTRPGLTIKARLVCALSCLAVVGGAETQAKFALSARDAGLSVADIREAVTLTVPWIGSPRALQALTIIGRALAA